MQRDETYEQDDRNYCLRHPQTETNLRCGRCGDLICPRCMVTSPVGARCPNCARVGRPKALDTSATEMGRAVFTGLIAAVVGAVALDAIIWVLARLPAFLDLIVIIAALAALGYLVGEAVRIGSGNKLDQRLKYVAATMAFTGWGIGVMLLPVFNLPVGFLGSFYGIIGMIVAVYVAMFRVRVP